MPLKEKKSQINNLIFYLKTVENKEQIKLKMKEGTVRCKIEKINGTKRMVFGTTKLTNS